jgi:hypothetical protein
MKGPAMSLNNAANQNPINSDGDLSQVSDDQLNSNPLLLDNSNSVELALNLPASIANNSNDSEDEEVLNNASWDGLTGPSND